MISLSAYTFLHQTVRRLASPLPTVPAIPTEKISEPLVKPNEVKFDDKTYSFYYHKIKSNETLELIPNFKEASFSGKIFAENNCSFGINGGFYTKENQPLGLFQIGEKKYSNLIESTTFNGLFENQNNALSIKPAAANIISYHKNDFVFQSGPIFFVNPPIPKNKQEKYIDKNYARRSLVAYDHQNNSYLFSFFEKDNLTSGPRLEDISDIFLTKTLASITNFDFVLNLDGGSASAFYDKNVQVEEFKPIGSFLCGKKK